MNRITLLQQLKERKLVQWALGYLAGAWVLLEFADFLGSTFTWPNEVLRVLTVVLGFAFLAVLVVAWYHGEKGHQRMAPTELLLLSMLASAAAVVSWRVVATPAAADVIASDSSNLAPMIAQVDGRKGIAVRPFTNMSADPENEYFTDGITEDIIARLSQIENLRVISRTSVMQYKNTDKTIRQIGRELGVEYVLEGSVRRTQNQVRIVAQLIDASTDEHVWSQTYDRDIRDILAVQSEVAEEIGSALKAELSPSVLADLREQPTVDPEAYRLVLEGRHAARSDAAAERARAAELFDEAIARDSSIAPVAYSAMVESVLPVSVSVGGPPAPPPNPKVEEALRRAQVIHVRVPEIEVLGAHRAMEQFDFTRAEEAARRAIEANPNYAPAHHWYGMLLGRTGRGEEALKHLRIAQGLDPHSAAINADLGELLYSLGRFDESIAQLEKTIALAPDQPVAHMNLGLAYHGKGDHEDALVHLRRAAELAPGNAMVQGYLGYVLAKTGQQDEARRMIEEMTRARRHGGTAGAVAQVLAGLGETERALDYLDQAMKERSAVLLSPRVLRSLDGLKSNPRFAEIMRLGVPGAGRTRAPANPSDTAARQRRTGRQ